MIGKTNRKLISRKSGQNGHHLLKKANCHFGAQPSHGHNSAIFHSILTAWQNSKAILFFFIDQYVPKVTLKCTFPYLWSDSECFEAYKDKERAYGKRERIRIL